MRPRHFRAITPPPYYLAISISWTGTIWDKLLVARHKHFIRVSQDFWTYMYAFIISYFSGYRQEEGGYVCPSDIFYGRPQRAVNTWGHWKVSNDQ